LHEQSHSSPALSAKEWGGSRIVVVGDNAGNLNGFQYSDGTKIWTYSVGKPIKSTPAIYGEVAYFTSWDGFLRAVDVTNGQELWRKDVKSGNQSSVAIMPDGSYGFINSDRGVCRFGLSQKKDLQCEEVEMTRATRKASPIITKDGQRPGNYLVWSACDRRAICAFDPKSFKRLNKWVLPSAMSGQVVPYNGKIFAMPEASDLQVLEK
jgi:hypothetical protein